MNRTSLSSRQLITLSVYLDGQLTSAQKAGLEKQLSESADLRQALFEMRRTRNALRQLKPKPVPRNFMLKPEMVSGRRGVAPASRWVPVLSFGSVAAAVLLVFTLVAGLLPLGMQSDQAALEMAATPVVEAPNAGEEDAAAAIPIITWGSGENTVAGPVTMEGVYATGKGGGGGGAEGGGAGGLGSGEIVISAPPAVITNDSGVPGFALIIPVEEQEKVTTESREGIEAETEDNFRVIDSGPILGLRITEEVQASAEEEPEPEGARRQMPSFMLPAAIVFGSAAILLALSAFMLKRKQHN